MEKEEKENLVERFIRLVVRCLVLGVWSIIGLVVWIPLLLRTVSIYSFSIVPLTLSGNKAALKRVAQALQAATTFYVNGFKLALSALRSDKPDESSEELSEPPLSLDSTLKEILISLAFWGLAFFSTGLIPIAITCAVAFVIIVFLKVILDKKLKPTSPPEVHRDTFAVHRDTPSRSTETPSRSTETSGRYQQGPNKSQQIRME